MGVNLIKLLVLLLVQLHACLKFLFFSFSENSNDQHRRKFRHHILVVQLCTYACAFGIILLSRIFLSLLAGNVFCIKSSLTRSLFQMPWKWPVLRSGQRKCSILEWRQKLMWNTATSPPPPLTSISFILYRKVLESFTLWNSGIEHACALGVRLC